MVPQVLIYNTSTLVLKMRNHMESDLCSCICRVGSSVSNLYTSLAGREPAGSDRCMEPCTEHSCCSGAEGGPVSSTLSVHMVLEIEKHEMAVSGE